LLNTTKSSLHEERKIPGNDLTADTHGLVAGVGEEGALDGDGLSVVLVGPACVVPVAADGQLQIGVK